MYYSRNRVNKHKGERVSERERQKKKDAPNRNVKYKQWHCALELFSPSFEFISTENIGILT